MTELPRFVDGARVLLAADLHGSTHAECTRHTVGGHVAEGFARLVIAQYASDTGVYLFYCDEQWTYITDTWHGDVCEAVDQAEYEFGSVEFVEVPATDTTTDDRGRCDGVMPVDFHRVVADPAAIRSRLALLPTCPVGLTWDCYGSDIHRCKTEADRQTYLRLLGDHCRAVGTALIGVFTGKNELVLGFLPLGKLEQLIELAATAKTEIITYGTVGPVEH